MIKIKGKVIPHVYVIGISIFIILAVVGLIMLRYSVEGERNLPFDIEEIHIISTGGGETARAYDGAWRMELFQENQIYFSIARNERYRRNESITSVVFDNFSIETENESGETNFYSFSEIGRFTLAEDYIIEEELKFTGAMETNLVEGQVNNQGGRVRFWSLNYWTWISLFWRN